MENFWKDKNVFVTGGNGFLGSHLVNSLVDRGAKSIVVLVYEAFPGGLFEEERLDEKTTVIHGDIRDFDLVKTILKEHDIQVIFHLAAQAIVDQAIDNPLETLEVNIQGTWNILEASRGNSRIEKIIIASSDKAYGEHTDLPYREDTHGLKAAYPYEVSKACADLLSQSYAKTFGLPVAITRCANLYGPGDLKINRLIPRTIFNLHHGKAPIIRDTGKSMRDYLYVKDAAEAYCLLAEKLNPSIYGEVFNFAMNVPHSVIEAIAVISKEMGKKIEPKVIQTHGFEIRHQYASYEKAKAILGWEPEHTFPEGLRKTIPWYIAYIKSAHGKDLV